MLLEADFPPDVRVEKEAMSLISKGHQVTVASYTFQNDKRTENLDGITILRKKISKFRYKSSIGALRFPFYFNFWRRYLGEIFRTNSIDVIHIHDLPLAKIGVETRKKYNIPFILDLHENYPALLDISTHTKKILAKFTYSYNDWRKYEQKMIRLADYVICVVEEMKQRLVDFGLSPGKVFVLENTPILNTSQIAHAKPEDGKVTLVYSGGINRHRGLQVVIAGLPKIRKKIHGIRLWIIGSGNYQPVLEKLISEYHVGDIVTFFGWKSREEMNELLMQSDITLIPHLKTDHSDHTFPNKLHEYALINKPVVSSDCNPLIRMVEEMQNGIIYKNDSPDDFAAAVIKLLESGDYVEMGTKGKKWVVKKYNWTVTEKTLFRLYDQIGNKS